MMLRRLMTALLLVLLLPLTALPPPAAGSAAPFIDPRLQATLATATDSQRIQAVVNYDSAVMTGPALATAIQSLGLGTITFKHLDSIAVLGLAAQIASIAALPGVTGLYPNTQLRYYLHESVPAIGADRVWTELGATGQGIGIAVIDSGIDATHPDLTLGDETVQNVKVLASPSAVYSFSGRSGQPLYLEDQRNTDATSGHGTHVAGIAAGSGETLNGYYTGVAKDAHLVGISVGEAIFVIWALAGFDYVLDNAQRYNITVINNSWGIARKAAEYDPEDPINQASKKAHQRGITVVFAVGNDGTDALGITPQTDAMNHYAMPPWVISVAAGCKPTDTSLCNGGQLAFFSSRGVPGDPDFHPTITAPGANIVSARTPSGAVNVTTLPFDAFFCNVRNLVRYTCASGTSMAAPHVAGTVALMQQAAGGRLRPDDVKANLTATAKPMYRADGTPYGLWEAGAGYLDAYAAVLASRQSTGSPTATSVTSAAN